MNSTNRLVQGFALGAVSCLVLSCTISDHSGKTFEGDSGGGGRAGADGAAGGAGSSARGGATSGGSVGGGGASGASGAGAGGFDRGGASNGGAGVSGGVSNVGGAASANGGASSAMGGAVNMSLGGASQNGGAANGGAANAMGGAVSAGLGGASTANGGNSGNSGVAGAPAGGDGCGQELLSNAGFEQGNANWALQSDFPGIQAIVAANDASLVAEGVAPRDGNYLAWLGGFPDNQFDSHYVGITQVLRIPQGASSLTLKGYIRIKTQEPDPKNTFDRGYIQFEWPDDRPDLLWLPVEWTVDQANNDWAAFSFVKMDTAQIAGKDVMIRLQAETDPSLKTSFWLDSLSLVATCGR